MRFTRYSSDGKSVIQEQIRLRQQQGENNTLPDKKTPDEPRSSDDGGARARFASRCRVLTGIDELLRSTAAAA